MRRASPARPARPRARTGARSRSTASKTGDDPDAASLRPTTALTEEAWTSPTTLAGAGSIVNSTGPLRLGGDSIWGEWFAGKIDDVMVYNRVLTQAEIQADTNRAVG